MRSPTVLEKMAPKRCAIVIFCRCFHWFAANLSLAPSLPWQHNQDRIAASSIWRLFNSSLYFVYLFVYAHAIRTSSEKKIQQEEEMIYTIFPFKKTFKDFFTVNGCLQNLTVLSVQSQCFFQSACKNEDQISIPSFDSS